MAKGSLVDIVPSRYRWRYGYPWARLLGSSTAWVVALGLAAWHEVVAPSIGGFVALLVILVAPALVVARPRPGVPVTADNQPELFALVHDVAVRAGFRPPHRIWLTHSATVEATVRFTRPELLVGRVVVPCVTEFELRALIAHELALLQDRRARLLVRLERLWSTASQPTDDSEGPPASSPPRRYERAAGALRPLAEAAHATADAAAAAAGGRPDVVARAVVLTKFAAAEYQGFLHDTAGPPTRWWRPILIEDFDDAWPMWLKHTRPDFRIDDEALPLLCAIVGQNHPGLAADALRNQLFSLSPVAPVRLRPLTRRHQRRLALRAHMLADSTSVRWYTFTSAPAQWWLDRAKAEAGGAQYDAAAVLGRDPVDEFETIEVAVTRNEEFVAAVNERLAWALGAEDLAPADSAPLDPDDYAPPAIICGLVEDALLRRGWRLEHPAIRGVLVGPGGRRVDAMRSVRVTEAGFDLELLRDVLRSGQAEHTH